MDERVCIYIKYAAVRRLSLNFENALYYLARSAGSVKGKNGGFFRPA